MVLSWMRDKVWLTDTEERKLLNKAVILVFFVHKNVGYSQTTDVTWTILMMSLLPF